MLIDLAADSNERTSYSEVTSSLGRRGRRKGAEGRGKERRMAREGRSTVGGEGEEGEQEAKAVKPRKARGSPKEAMDEIFLGRSDPLHL